MYTGMLSGLWHHGVGIPWERNMLVWLQLYWPLPLFYFVFCFPKSCSFISFALVSYYILSILFWIVINIIQSMFVHFFPCITSWWIKSVNLKAPYLRGLALTLIEFKFTRKSKQVLHVVPPTQGRQQINGCYTKWVNTSDLHDLYDLYHIHIWNEPWNLRGFPDSWKFSSAFPHPYASSGFANFRWLMATYASDLCVVFICCTNYFLSCYVMWIDVVLSHWVMLCCVC